jgi:hypothetical protein
MSFRALAVVPENELVFLEELDLHIDFDTIDKDYLVHGYEPPMEYVFYTKAEFDKEWRFLFGQEHPNKFSHIVAR